jgi:hypothetical protein
MPFSAARAASAATSSSGSNASPSLMTTMALSPADFVVVSRSVP